MPSVAQALRSDAAPNQPPQASDHSKYVAVPSGAPPAVTFGFPICSLDPAARITDVTPTATKGDGFSVVEIRVATFNPTDGYTLASPGYPPKPRPNERHQTVQGASPTACSDHKVTSEIQIGMRKTGAAGGGWAGAKVDYTVAGRSLNLVIPFEMLLCGDIAGPC